VSHFSNYPLILMVYIIIVIKKTQQVIRFSVKISYNVHPSRPTEIRGFRVFGQPLIKYDVPGIPKYNHDSKQKAFSSNTNP
jgi:hypothetical protein